MFRNDRLLEPEGQQRIGALDLARRSFRPRRDAQRSELLRHQVGNVLRSESGLELLADLLGDVLVGPPPVDAFGDQVQELG